MKKYQIIYADPPWSYDDVKGHDPAMGGLTYPSMTDQEICDMVYELRKYCAENCALFLWVTMPKLDIAFKVMKAWGFDYVTCAFTWVKQNKSGDGIYSGLGHWTNGNAELCLFARRGSPKRIAKDVKQIILAPVARHSAKPSEVRDRIVSLMGDLPRLELFARQKIDGWDVWGNEVESDIILA